MELHEIKGFRPPDGAVIGTVTTADGVSLRFARWAPLRRAKGTVAIFAGRSEMIERYYEVVGELRERGLAVAVLDWRGQGGSARSLRDPAKGHVRSFAEYDRDLDAFVSHVVLPDCPPPYFAFGHSMGGLVLLRALRDGRVQFPRVVLSAPMIAFGPTRPPQPTACRIAAAITRLGLGAMAAHGQARETIDTVAFDGNRLTSDPARFERGVALCRELPEVFIGGPTYAWIHAACRAMREAADPKFPAAIRVPALLVAGSLEEVVSLQAIERFGMRMRAGTVVVIPGAHHELLMEREALRAQFWAAFDAFIPGS